MRKNAILTAVFTLLPIWWIFQILWLPGFMHVVADVAYRFEPIQLSALTATSARNRAFEYATRGGGKSDDIYFTSDEVSHLVDVSRLYSPISMALNTVAVISWSILFLAVYKSVDFRKAFVYSSRALVCLLVTLSTCLLAFGIFFDTFHRLLFPGGNWAFPADSLLITLFPETFWKLELTSILLLLILVIVLYWILSSSNRREAVDIGDPE